MELINNFGPIGKLMYKSNVASVRYISYYFDEHITETNFYENTHLMVNINDVIPDGTTCLMINVKISFEHLNRLICDTGITSVVFFKDMFVENIDTGALCKNIITIVCYNIVSLNMINRFFPNIRSIFMFRQNETVNGKRVARLPVYKFDQLQELHIYSSGSSFKLEAPNLEQLSIYSSYNEWSIDVKIYPKLHTLRIDEKINITNLRSKHKWHILQYYPSSRQPAIDSNSETTNANDVDVVDLKVDDLILPPTKKYMFKINKNIPIMGVYVNDVNFFANTLTIGTTSMQVLDNVYPMKMCNLRFSNTFYKYFPFPNDIDSELVERFNVQRERETLIMIFNFDIIQELSKNKDWQTWYNICIETYHRIPILIQNGQLMLEDGTSDTNEKIWPNIVSKVRNECIILLSEEELIYINCSPQRLQTLIDKIKEFRRQRFIISKLWLVTNGFEISTKDIEERIDNLIIVHNEVKMYITF